MLVLTVPGRPTNANDRMHRMARAARTKKVRRLAGSHALAQWGPVESIPALVFPVTIIVVDWCKSRLRDTTNAAPHIKAIVDGLTDFGLWPDDNPPHVAEYRYLPARVVGADAVVLTIVDASENVEMAAYLAGIDAPDPRMSQ